MKYIDLDCQIQNLKLKGVRISNDEYAKMITKRYGYSNIRRYSHMIFNCKNEKYHNWVKFNHLQEVFNFNRRLMMAMIEPILECELIIKNAIIESACSEYSDNLEFYLEQSNYIACKDDSLSNLIEDLKFLRDAAIDKSVAGTSYIPLWKLSNDVSFGMLWKFIKFQKLEVIDKFKIRLSPSFSLKKSDIGSILKILTLARNIIAHDGTITNFKPNTTITHKKYHDHFENKHGHRNIIYYGNLFALFVIIKGIVGKNMFNKMIDKVQNAIQLLSSKVANLDEKTIILSIGLPIDYHELSEIEK